MVRGKYVFGIIPTGFGKSLIFQLFPRLAKAAIILENYTIIVFSPLISIMSLLLVPNMVISKMNNHEHRTKQTYESSTFQPLTSFCFELMHLSMVCPRMGGRATHVGGDFDIHNGPQGVKFDSTAIFKSGEDLRVSEWSTILENTQKSFERVMAERKVRSIVLLSFKQKCCFLCPSVLCL